MSAVILTQDSHSRDLRIDFFRGAALLVILIDHFELFNGIKWLSSYTLQEYSPADALDVFIFISGFVFGLIYSRMLDRNGLGACQKKAFRRAGQLYLTQVGLYFAIFACIIIPMRDHTEFLKSMLFEEAVQTPVKGSVYATALVYQPADFDILPIYIIFLLFMPVLLYASRNSRLAVVFGSFAVYSLTQLWPSLNLPNYSFDAARQTWLFDPLSWQFLFVIAMILGSSREASRLRYLKSPMAIMISLVVVLNISFQYVGGKFGIEAIVTGPLPFINKCTLGPLRLVYSLCLIHLVASICPREGAFWKSFMARPIVLCGQHPLPVFAFGVVIHYLSVCLVSVYKVKPPSVQLVELCALCASIFVAYLFKHRTHSPRVPATEIVG